MNAIDIANIVPVCINSLLLAGFVEIVGPGLL